MRLLRWDALPETMRTEAVRPYYELLAKKRGSLLAKRIFDVAAAVLVLILLWPVFLLLAAAIRLDSPGPVFYRQVRLTQYGREFRIFKFRTMTADADWAGMQVTVSGDPRITRLGQFLRRCRLDEMPQLMNVLRGEMSFVGTRPEVPKYVASYSPEMWATLLLPAGITSEASIRYKDEDRLLRGAEDAEEVYIRQVLPRKMRYNLDALRTFSFFRDLRTMLRTVLAVIGKSCAEEEERAS